MSEKGVIPCRILNLVVAMQSNIFRLYTEYRLVYKVFNIPDTPSLNARTPLVKLFVFE
jgi:hypothetical protein